MRLLKLTMLAGTLCFQACKTNKETVVVATPPPDCSTKTFSYAVDIQNIIETNCVRCHGENGADGLNFNHIEDVKKAANKGELLGTIKHEKGFPKMPKYGTKLDQQSIDKIECWIKTGMKE
ncbi:MAG: cytochrome c [Bacteroidetes bacterium]|nr:cytochrome c [Bacteroidota bacterium]